MTVKDLANFVRVNEKHKAELHGLGDEAALESDVPEWFLVRLSSLIRKTAEQLQS